MSNVLDAIPDDARLLIVKELERRIPLCWRSFVPRVNRPTTRAMALCWACSLPHYGKPSGLITRQTSMGELLNARLTPT